MAHVSRAVRAGSVAIGGGARVSVQSMTNTRTADLERTAAQIASLEDAGCEIVRFAVLDEADAMAVGQLREGARVPLVADIHFDYKLALLCIENGVDKLRINPGNIGSAERIKRVADCAKAHGVPIRIGVNSGSLEKELLAKYGAPTPQALAESALSHARLLERAGYEDGIVLSAKSSSVRDTVEAYRLLAARCNYPLHLGVT
ncbi:MAG TPA: flavodoxin/ferredoxin-dependent (E)-4-hydroxy-3-methylbut-2-enyl-diphosphate synthase, partial [Clostridia bacterium]|nr:flavodoxin/ferredoxin-dependent (E)-4-hydroxy-3-methylbut-2-enyl-diphosphate synthase [Clostridia bacterium]